MIRLKTPFRLIALAVIAFAMPAWADQAAPASSAPSTAASAAAGTADAPSAQTAVPVSPSTAADAKQMTCRTVKITGSNLRTRKVCSTPNSEKGAGDWVRDQQDRGAIGASAIPNAAGGG